MTGPEVGVLLPVRLETRFVAQPDGTWKLRVRVVPDAVSITTHDETPTDVELDGITRFWRELNGADLQSPAGQRALRALVAAVGFERAAWLARSFPAVTGSDGEVTIQRPDTTRDGLRGARLLGLPPSIELWWARGGGVPQLAATLAVLVDEIDLDFADPDGPRGAWWASFEEALRVGLAAELELGSDPTAVDVLYAVGVGGGDPGPLLAAQADSGRVSVIPIGTATATIDGAPAASLGDGLTELSGMIVPNGSPQPAADDVGAALRVALPPMTGGDASHQPVNQALVRSLWPALWGHGLANVLGYAPIADPLGVWAAENLVPQGPLPALRVAKQPYGLLPATSLAHWVTAPEDPAVEQDLVPLVRELLRRWAQRAEAAKNGTDRSVETVLRTPTATRYEWRWLVPDELAQAVAFRFAAPIPGASMRTWIDARSASAPAIGARPVPNTRLLSVGWGHPVTLPLTGGSLHVPDPTAGDPSGVDGVLDQPVSSLLGELARHSLAASAAVVARTAAAGPRAIVEPLSADAATAGELDTWAVKYRPVDLDDSPASLVHRNVLAGLDALGRLPDADVARGLAALLDTATHRIDPWAVAIAWRRLQALAGAPRSLGVYGWVDAPRPRTSPPSPEYVLAPSLDQAQVAAVLRDRAIRDPDEDRWRFDLDSERVRGALRLNDEVRAGGHPAEVVGRLVEQIVQWPDVIEELRTNFPLRTTPGSPRLQVRRVCDGTAVAAAARDTPLQLDALGVDATQLAALRDLDLDLDALADLQVAESVHGLVRARPAAVAAATAAGAGTGMPSALEVVRTPRAARSVTTVAVLVLPVADSSAGSRPVQVADAAVADFLDARAGDPAGADWTWPIKESQSTVTLADIGLLPSDTVALGADNLAQVLRDATGEPGVAAVAVAGHARVRALAAALAGIPGLPEDVSEEPVDASATEGELQQRLAAVRVAAEGAVTRWQQAATGDDDHRAALVDAARWGITPLTTDAADPDGELGSRVELAAGVLTTRLAAAVDDATAADLGAGPLAEQITALIAPEAAYPVLGRVPASVCATLVPDGPAAGVDPDWLATVAPVRRALARLEAAQLDEVLRPGGTPLVAWTNRPSDTWQTTFEVNSEAIAQPTRLVAAFGPSGVLPGAAGETVALGVLDRFSEGVPALEHDAAVAFRHDLPVARAPQAVVLAVPPDVEAPLDGAVLVAIVSEVRELAHARLVDPADLGADAGVLHLAALSATGRTGVRLDGSST